MTLVLLLAIAAGMTLLFLGRGFLGWLAAVAVYLSGWSMLGVESWFGLVLMLLLLGGVTAVLGLPLLRRKMISGRVITIMAKVLPRLGETERIALDAGTVWWDAELFSGQPDWQKLVDFKVPPLSAAEQAFLDGPVEQVCAMLDDWQVHQQRDLPPEVWAYLKDQRFFGMIIPQRYGGLEFSAIGNARVVSKLASRSITAAVTVMVPNSLGPAELLLRYGTDEQKEQLLPRLARGEEVPCFALTGPEAGSDAAATQSIGIVESREVDGREVMGMRLSWNKRYITLAPVATLIGLAFRLKDPQHLLGERAPAALRAMPAYQKDGDLGITCALIPRTTPGVEIGERHDPMGVPFMNGPTRGADVFVPLHVIIGGDAGIGNGWRMLMESLAAGRSISLPALAVASAQMATRVVGAYATVREQFDTPIGRFEGIEEPLARIAGLGYVMTAARTLTCGALDVGENPSVISAIVKAYLTDGMRQVMCDAMDIRAGAAVQRGPRNILANAWQAVPIAITVEGANILTRSMIIYGQGAIRCHPFVQKEIAAIAADDLSAFDKALFGHVNFIATSACRALLLALTRSVLAKPPRGAMGTERLYQYLSRFSAAFALISDAAMSTLGGSLKRREKICGRLADALAWMYLASAALKRFHDDAKPGVHHDLVRWAGYHALYRIQNALSEVIDNLPNRPVAWALRAICFPLGMHFRPPRDQLGGRVARELLEDRAARADLSADIYLPPANEPGLGRLEAALDQAVAVLPIETKLRDAVRAGRIDRAPGQELADSGLAAGVITAGEHAQLNEARELRDEVIQVDSFTQELYRTLR